MSSSSRSYTDWNECWQIVSGFTVHQTALKVIRQISFTTVVVKIFLQLPLQFSSQSEQISKSAPQYAVH